MSPAPQLSTLAAQLPQWAWPAPPRFSPQQSTAPAGEPVGPLAYAFHPPLPGGTGPLAGLTLAVKENYAVAGRPLVAGLVTREREPVQPADAPLVGALRVAGMTLVGTARMHELAFGVTGVNVHEGTPEHPADPARMPGGSSSGSAVAVAAGLADLALATDTGGSARIPAALVGVVGYKATRALATDGILPLSPTLDHVGWCSRDLDVTLRVAEVLGLRAGSAAPSRPRLGVLRPALEAAEPAVREAVEAALAALQAAGAELVELAWPHLDLTVAVTSTIMFAEAAAGLLAYAEDCAPDVAGRLRLGAATPPAAYQSARELGRLLTADWAAAVGEVDAVLAPTTGVVAPALGAAGDPGVVTSLLRTTRLADLTGDAAITVPLTTGGLPIGLQVSAPTDAGALGVARWAVATL